MSLLPLNETDNNESVDCVFFRLGRILSLHTLLGSVIHIMKPAFRDTMDDGSSLLK